MNINSNSSMYTANNLKMHSNKINKNNVSENSSNTKIEKSGELGTIKLDKFDFDNVKNQTERLEVIGKTNYNTSSENDYRHIFDSRVSKDDIYENGIGVETNGIYDKILYGDGTGVIKNSGKTLQEKMTDSAEKYDILARKIQEQYGDNKQQFETEMKALNEAFEHNSKALMQEENIHNFMFMDKNKQSLLMKQGYNVAEKYSQEFIESYNTNDNINNSVDYSKLSNDLLREAFPEETTSLTSISYKDYEIISKTEQLFYNKGTGLDVIKSLSENKDLSEILRNEYERLSKADNLFGLTFNATV